MNHVSRVNTGHQSRFIVALSPVRTLDNQSLEGRSIDFLFMPLQPLGDAGGIMFSCRPSVCACVRPSVMSPRYIWYALMDFHQIFVSSATWDKDELIRF